MTALDKFDRLESEGLWREHAEAQRRDVGVSFGKATLVISDSANRPLAHWSLPAVRRRNPGERPAIFAPDDDASETLAIADDTMADAIEEVRRALIRARPHPGRLRGRLMLALCAALAAVAVLWAPQAFTQKTLSVVPQSKRTEIGATILGHYQRLTGPTCRGAAGTTALGVLRDRLLGPGNPGQFVVVQDLPQGAVALPGGVILIDRRLVEQHDDPSIVAGYILAAVAGHRSQDPLQALLEKAGLRATMTLFTTGDLPDAVLNAYADDIRQRAETQTSPTALRAAFEGASVLPQPYLDARRASAETYAALTDLRGAPRPVLDDGDWVKIQGICSS